MNTGDGKQYFFQRIYNRTMFETRLRDDSGELDTVSLMTVRRRFPWLASRWSHLGENARGLFGFLNTWLSAVLNETCEGFYAKAGDQYGPVFKSTDVCGDLLMAARKRNGNA